MGSRGPAAPPGSGSTGPGGGQARLGQTGGGNGVSSAGGGTTGGQEPTPMDMSIGPQPNQPMTAPHGMPDSGIQFCHFEQTDCLCGKGMDLERCRECHRIEDKECFEDFNLMKLEIY